MDGFNDWIYPTTLVGDAVKVRPLVLGLLYRKGINPWGSLESTLAEICTQYRIDVAEFLIELERLPLPDPDSEWENHPVFHLIDMLTQEHRHFLHIDLPAIDYMMKMAGDGGLVFRISQTLREFTQLLRAHIVAEEEEIFPIVLRNEFTNLNPLEAVSFHPTARQVCAAARIPEREREFKFALDQLTEQVSLAARDTSCSATVLAVVRLIKQLEWNILAHTRLETDRLYPMAARIEERLADFTQVI